MGQNIYDFELSTGGLNLIMGHQFIGWIPYTKHYRDHYNTKLYLEPWNYLGFYTFPELFKQYPETSCIAECNKNLEFENPIKILDEVFVNQPRKLKPAIESCPTPVPIDEEQ